VSESYSIGVDLGGTNLRVASYRHGSGILETVILFTRRSAGRDAVLADLCAAIGKLRATIPATYRLVGAGGATPGPMELPSGRLLDPPNLPGWGNFPLLSELQRLLRCDVKLENEANVAALAEARLGLGKDLGVNSLCMLTLGTDVGCGLVLKNSIWHGMNGMAGEAGHISFDPNGAPRPCGTNGCLELSASATGLVKMAREAMSGRDGRGLMALAQRCPDFTAEDLFLLAAGRGPWRPKVV
jgi:glucokinase